MQIRRRSPNPAIDVSILRYQAIVPDAAPNNILEEIVWQKEVEYDQMREKVPLQELRKQVLTAPPTRDFVAVLTQ
jgi:indole-3-glycerol phosphate synthase